MDKQMKKQSLSKGIQNSQNIFLQNEQQMQKKAQQKQHNSNDELYKEYEKVMGNVPCQNLQSLHYKLKQNGIKVNDSFNPFEKVIIERINNAYSLKIRNGYYETQISLLKIDMDSNLLNRKYFRSGAYAKIFIEIFQNKIYAIKSQDLPKHDLVNFTQNFDLILHEYLALKIASILEFGPKIQSFFGFDIICFNDSVQFSMQFCATPSIWEVLKYNNFQKDLDRGLKTMHSLRMVHRDTKNTNISWSSQFNKWIFLDFGFSTFLKQKPGTQTFTSFRGTYEFTSKEMRTLFHLKKPGFIDLYGNDAYGLEIVKENPFKHKVQQVPLQNSGYSSFFTAICKMQFYIFSQNFFMVEFFFKRYVEYKHQFFKLLLRALERNKALRQNEKSEIFFLYEKLKEVSLNSIGNIEKDDQKYFKLFIQQIEESNRSNFFFLNESKLNELLQDKWEQFSFLKELFVFFDEVLYSNSKHSWKRMKLITNILANIWIGKCQEKSWLWKFNRILNLFQQKFIQNQQYHHLKQITFYHYLLNFPTGWSRLRQIQFKFNCTLLQDKLDNFILNFYQLILYFPSQQRLTEVLYELKTVVRKQIATQQYQDISMKIAEIITEISCSKKLRKEKVTQLEQLFKKLKQVSLPNEFYREFIQYGIEIWLKYFSKIYFYENEQYFLPTKTIERKNKYFLLKVIEKLEKLKEYHSNLSVPYFQSYEILKQIPRLYNFEYNFKRRNFIQLNEHVQNLFKINQQNLQQINEELTYILTRWSSTQNVQQQVQFMLNTFLKEKKIMKQEKLRKYWNFIYSKSLTFFELANKKKKNQSLKNKIIQFVKMIIDHFDLNDLSLSSQIYVHLFISFYSFLKQNPIRVDEWLENIKKRQLFKELKENIYVLCEFLSCFVYYQSVTDDFHFYKNAFYKTILDDNMVNCLFCQVPAFLEYVLIMKSQQNRQKEALKIIKCLSNFLMATNDQLKGLCFIYYKFMRKNDKQRLFQIIKDLIQLQTFSSFCQSNYLSAFLFMIYLQIQHVALQQLNFRQLKRVFIFSIISIDKFPFQQRQVFRKFTGYKFRFLEQKLKPRKKFIRDRKEDYSRDGILLIQKEMLKKVQKKERFHGKLKNYFQRKLKYLEKNVKSQISETRDHQLQKII